MHANSKTSGHQEATAIETPTRQCWSSPGGGKGKGTHAFRTSEINGYDESTDDGNDDNTDDDDDHGG